MNSSANAGRYLWRGSSVVRWSWSFSLSIVSLAVVVGIVAALRLIEAFVYHGFDLSTNDFASFYLDARWLRLGGPLQDGGPISMNPPTFALLGWPLSFLSQHAAYWTWTALGLVSLFASLTAIHNRYNLTPAVRICLVAGIVALEPSLANLMQGQVGWVLCYPITKAFLSQEDPRRAGVWLGIAVALKPTLAVLVLCLPFVYWLPSAVVALSISVVAFAVTGPAPWLNWLARSELVTFFMSPHSASFYSIAARFQGLHSPATIADLSLLSWAFVLAGSLVWVGAAWRATGARAWAFAALAPLLIQPLGWSYYFVIGLAPLVATWRDSWASRLALAFWLLPWTVYGLAVGIFGPGIGGLLSVVPVALLWYSLGGLYEWTAAGMAEGRSGVAPSRA